VSGFKQFLLQGNLVQLAVAVVIGVVFGQLVEAFTTGFITPLLGIFGGVPEFSGLYFEINESRFLYGQFIDALIAFLMTAAVIYFFVVAPVAKLLERMNRDEAAKLRECPHCLSEIAKAADRCPHCTSVITPEEIR
jgi:large conductance mechanosensitive channel